uniref:Insulin-like growth factor-binding protein 3 n=1 Tax=Electrophorus electricus TaxID=8005 RepID=A0AAY5EHM8_ELEEL
MVATLCSLSITVILASIARLSQSVGTVIRCEPCGAGAQMLCKPVPKDCAERVREPGCGCCLTCALLRGQPCGIYTGKCGVGLTCQPQPGEMKPLQALLEGRGICVNSTLKKSERTSPLVTTQEGRERGREGERERQTISKLNILDPHGFRIPNCDKKGFYKKKQCRPSKGRKRGMCWCVDKYGQPLPGFHGKERGSAHCFAIENQ